MHTHLKSLIETFGRGSVPELQILPSISLGFFRLFKWDELSNKEVQDIIFSTDHMTIFVEKRKRYQFREGFWGFIASTNGPYCSVSLTIKFLHLGRQHCSEGMSLQTRLRRQRLTYSRAWG